MSSEMQQMKPLPDEPPAAAPTRSPTSVHRRVAWGLLLSSILGVGLLHWMLLRQFDAQKEARSTRATMIQARAAGAIATHHGAEGDALRAAITDWAREHPTVKAVRVINIESRTIEASTFPEDVKEGPAPRTMQRPEKALYDLGQSLRANLDTNTQLGKKQDEEVSIEQRADGILIAVPVEKGGQVVGMAQILSVPEVVAVEPPGIGVALVVALLPFAVVFAASFVLRRPRAGALTAVAAILLLASIFGYRQRAASSLVSGARAAEQRVAERVEREKATVQKVSPGAEAFAATWDADNYRTPLRIDVAKASEAQKRTIARWSWPISLVALALLLFIGLGLASRIGAGLRRNRHAYYYIAPAMVGMVLLVFFPFIYGIALSFTSQNIYSVNKPLTELFVGLQNYGDILGDFNPIRHTDAGRVANYENFYWTLFFTVMWTIANVTIGVTLGLILALMLNTKGLRFKGGYRVLLILPWAMPNYITALIWRGMFHQQFGVVNQVIQLWGGSPIAWFERPFTSFCALVATNGWLSFPFMMVISLGALQSIPGDLYEAARVDGASKWQQFVSITLPSLKPSLVPAVILSVVWTFNMFNIPYLVSGGEPAHSTEILITQAYKVAFEQYRYGYAAAYSTVIFAILLIYGVFQNRVTRATESIT